MRPKFLNNRGCLPQSVAALLLVASFAVAGCVDGVGTSGGSDQSKKPAPGKTTLSDFAFQAFQKRDALRAEKLRGIAEQIKSGELKYDGPVMEAIEKAGAEASLESWEPVKNQLAKLLNDNAKKLDAVKAERAIRDLADGAERASK